LGTVKAADRHKPRYGLTVPVFGFGQTGLMVFAGPCRQRPSQFILGCQLVLRSGQFGSRLMGLRRDKREDAKDEGRRGNDKQDRAVSSLSGVHRCWRSEKRNAPL
jgi:hypothetical protein